MGWAFPLVGGYFLLVNCWSALVGVPGHLVVILLFQRINTLLAYQYAHSVRWWRINTLIQYAHSAYQYAHSASIRLHSAHQYAHSQRINTLTASADAHSVSKRPQRINAPTAYDTHIFHSVSTRPQRINTPTTHGTHCAHSVSIRPQRYGDASVAATLQGIQGIKGGAPDFEFIPCLTFVGDAVSPLYD